MRPQQQQQKRQQQQQQQKQQQQQQQQQQQKKQQLELQQRQQESPAADLSAAADDAEDGSSRSSGGGSSSSQQQPTPQQLRSQRIQQQLANYRPKQLRGKREPPMVPSPSFAAAAALACLGCLLTIGGGVCLAKQCNSSSEVGIALLVTSGLSVAVSAALFASLPCCYCDKARNCQVRAACAERWQQLRYGGKRRQSRFGSIGGVPVIIVKDYSSSLTSGRTSPATTLPQQSPTSSSDGGRGGGGGVGSGRRMSTPMELSWCYEGAPADPGMLHPMYWRRGSWNGSRGQPDFESSPPTSARRV